MEGDSVTLHTETEIQKDDLILWWGGTEDSPMAEVNRSAQIISISGSTEGFKDRLHLDPRTGSLTVRNIRTNHSGIYKAQIIGKKVSKKMYNVTVYAHLPVPIITRDCSSSSSSSSSHCSLLCSVLNVSHVTLSWYKGVSVLFSISVCDISTSFSLHLEVEYQDENTYSCVLKNPISNQTTHLDIGELCQKIPDSECVHCCGSTEAVIRLVLSALVGVATVAVLGFDIASRKAEQKRRAQKSTSVLN
ncbi:SLAM family member 5-like [Siphateles boraxobius]|uniref:SLAM family member 5-like n=1 Tax=Siphateles boraxobius TaxID=180520 RepID=UPI004063B920